jgi:ATP-dependent Clp protease ATP-binding subunit ClpC
MTSNAAAEEIQQIIKAERAERGDDFKEENLIKDENSTDDSTEFEDEYSGAIKFLKSPITENFLVDIKEQLRVEFEKSFRTLKDYDVLEKEIKSSKKASNHKNDEKTSNLKGAVLERLSTMFLPEFLNRLDDIIIFQPLKPEELRKICDIMVKEVGERVKPKQILLSVDDKVKVKLTREGYNPMFGARPLRRLVTKYIEDLISENILKNPSTKKMRTIKIQLNEDDQIVVKKEESVFIYGLTSVDLYFSYYLS